MRSSDLFYIAGCFIIIGLIFMVGVLFGRSRSKPPAITIVFEPDPAAAEKREAKPLARMWTFTSFVGDIPLSEETYLGKLAVLSTIILLAEQHERAEA
jgi:hypothetical protein